jgi:hypothetical protein
MLATIADQSGGRVDVAIGVGGFPLTGVMRRRLQSLDLRRYAPPRGSAVHIIRSAERAEGRELADVWRDAGASVRMHDLPLAATTQGIPACAVELLPRELLGSIVTSLRQDAA